jgi:hypothetical protein
MRGIGVAALASVWLALLSAPPVWCAEAAAAAAPKLRSASLTSPPAARAMTAEETAREAWLREMPQKPLLGGGCAKAEYPEKEWRETPCAKEAAPAVQRGGLSPLITGQGFDYVAQVSGVMTYASGAFAPIAGLTSENTDTGLPNAYSIQLNTNTFHSPLCQGSSCMGWQQFVYWTSPGSTGLHIQYWLQNYEPTGSCPTTGGWTFSPAKASKPAACYKDGPAAAVPAVPATALDQVSLTGFIDSSNNEYVSFAYGKAMYQTPASPSVLGLAGAWKQAEFNVFGEGGGDEAIFSAGTVMSVDLKLNGSPGAMGAVSCLYGGTSGEYTNMVLSDACYAGYVDGWSQIAFGESVPPQVDSINPSQGPEAGGTKVDIVGQGFIPSTQQNEGVDNITSVAFGSAYVGATCDTSTHCTAYTPRTTAPFTVYVTAINSTSIQTGKPGEPNAPFAYLAYPEGTISPSSGPTGGGTTVTLSGANLNNNGTQIAFDFSTGAQSARDIACTNAPSNSIEPQVCTFQTPPLSPAGPGPVAVAVTASAYRLTTIVGDFTYGPVVKPPPPPPPPVCHCGGGQKCCPDPDGGRGFRCVAASARCPPLQ